MSHSVECVYRIYDDDDDDVVHSTFNRKCLKIKQCVALMLQINSSKHHIFALRLFTLQMKNKKNNKKTKQKKNTEEQDGTEVNATLCYCVSSTIHEH